MKKKEQFASEANKTRAKLHETEMRLSKRDDILDRQAEQLQNRDKKLKQQEKEAEKRVHNIGLKEKQLSILMAQQKNQLLKITAMDIEEAKELLLKRLEDECEHEMSALIQRKLEECKETSIEKSREVISAAIQRYAAEQTCEVSVSTVDIPNDDMKGRVIGREGRNIRAFEKATGAASILSGVKLPAFRWNVLYKTGEYIHPASRSSSPRPKKRSIISCYKLAKMLLLRLT
ncbi:MAG: Rnase Y domain-containing protein [Planctomycetota bacterium]